MMEKVEIPKVPLNDTSNRGRETNKAFILADEEKDENGHYGG